MELTDGENNRKTMSAIGFTGDDSMTRSCDMELADGENNKHTGFVIGFLLGAVGILILILLLSDNGTAAIILVPNDHGTIQGAVDVANEGDSIYVDEGIYRENIIISKGLNLSGETGTTIDGGLWIRDLHIFRSQIKIENLVIENGTSIDSTHDYGIKISGDIGFADAEMVDMLIVNNKMVNCGRTSSVTDEIWWNAAIFFDVKHFGAMGSRYDSVFSGSGEISNNTIINDLADETNTTQLGIGVRSGRNLKINDNVISGNVAEGIHHWGPVNTASRGNYEIDRNHIDLSDWIGGPVGNNPRGIWSYAPQSSISNNTVISPWYGIQVRYWDDSAYGGINPGNYLNMTVSHNLIHPPHGEEMAMGLLFSGGNSEISFNEIYGATNMLSNNRVGLYLFGMGNTAGESSICSGNTFTENIVHDNYFGIYIEDTYTFDNVFRYNAIFNNTNFGMKNSNSGESVDAGFNWWGEHSGPSHAALNQDGMGNNVSDDIDFTPWWETRSGSIAPSTTIGTGVPRYGYNISESTPIYINATDSESGVGSIHYRIDGGTVFIAPGNNTTFHLTEGGSHRLEYWAVDNAETEGFHSNYTFYVDVTPPTAIPGPDRSVDQGVSLTFDGSGSSDNVEILNYTWTFNDSGIRTLFDICPSFKFDNAGQFEVTLNVTDICGNYATAVVGITVNDTTLPALDAGNNLTIGQGDTVTFNGSRCYDNVGVANYTWTFTYDGIGRILYGKKSDFTFEIPGSYIVWLKITDAAGNWLRGNLTVLVNDTESPIAKAGNDREINKGSFLNFNASNSTDNVGIVNYTWTFEYDQGEIVLYGKDVSFTFSIPGRYTINLMVRDEAGNTANDTIVVVVFEIIRDEVASLSMGPFTWEDGEPIVGATLELITTTRSTGTHTAITDHDGIATFTDEVSFGEYDWTLKRTEKGTTYSIMSGTIDLDVETPSGETWWPKENEEVLISAYTEDELDELHGIGASSSTTPSEKFEKTFLEDVPRVVEIGERDLSVNVTETDDGYVMAKIDEGRELKFNKDMARSLDTDGDGENDLKVTYRGDDDNGNPILEFEEVPKIEKEASPGKMDKGMILMVCLIGVIILVVFILIARRSGKRRDKGILGGEKGGPALSSITEVEVLEYLCPGCDAVVPEDAAVCLNCGTTFEEDEEEIVEEEIDGETAEKREEVQFRCSECGTLVGESEAACSGCGVEFETEEDEEEIIEYQCPECEAVLQETASVCLNCGTVFVDEEELGADYLCSQCGVELGKEDESCPGCGAEFAEGSAEVAERSGKGSKRILEDTMEIEDKVDIGDTVEGTPEEEVSDVEAIEETKGWEKAIDMLKKGDEIVSKSGTRRIVLSVKGDDLGVRVIGRDGTEREQKTGKELLKAMARNIKNIIPSHGKEGEMEGRIAGLEPLENEKAGVSREETKRSEDTIELTPEDEELDEAELDDMLDEMDDLMSEVYSH